MTKRLLMISLLILVTLLVACRNQPDPTPTPEPTLEPTPEPPATEAPPTEEVVDSEESGPTLVASVAGLQGNLWQWERSVNPGTGEETLVANPENYTLTFNADDTYNFRADCNVGAGAYTADDNGNIRFMPGPVTLAACPPESLSDAMLNMMTVVQTYSLEEDGNVLRLSGPDGNPVDYYRNAGPADSTQVPAEEATADPELVGPTWYWQRFDDTAEVNNIVVDDPSRYTITFNADGTAAIRADCNQVIASYTTADGALTIIPGPSTLAACPPDSLDQQFIANLSNVATYVIEEGTLYLNLFADAGNMVFGGNNVGIDPRQVNIHAGDLDIAWQANLVPGTPYDESSPPGPMGLPAHIMINFGEDTPVARQVSGPVMYIIPVSAYEALWNEAGNPSVSDTVAQVYEYTLALPFPSPTSGMPALPYEELGGVNDLATQLGNAPAYEISATKNGYRFVGRWGQGPNPVTNQGLRYVYQGFTNDGQYLVTFFYPVATAALPDTAADVPAEEISAVDTDPAAYNAQKATELNALTSADWEPSLQTLDNLVGSLTIDGMPPNGLTGNVWLLTAQSGPEGEQPLQTEVDHTVTFSEGSLNWQGECNTGTGRYAIRGGVAGSLAIDLGATTLAACPDSMEEVLVATLGTTQSYRVHPGGAQMDLLLPLSAGYLSFAKYGPADAAPEAGQPELPIEPPAAGAPTGRVIAPLGLNIRTGPASSFPVIGIAPFGAEGEIIGRSADGQFWATPIESAPNGIGWAAAAYVEATDVENVPVIAAPAPPIPTATPLPPATATPAPDINFSASPTVINQGACTTLSWNVQNIQAVWVYPLGQPYTQFPATGQGSRQECPAFTTTYEMRVLKTDGTVELRQVTIFVNTANPLANTNWQLATRNVNQPPLPDSVITLMFAIDQLSGNGGCNTYNGAYAVTGSSLSISPLTATRTSCGEELDAQEAAYLQALQSAVTYQLLGAQLIIRDAFGAEVLRFNRTG